MKKFSQKWVVVAFLEPISEGYEFFWKEWPMHITILPPYAIDIDVNKIGDLLAVELSGQKKLQAKAEDDLQWDDLTVVQISKTPEITKLHNDLVDLMTKNGAIFNEPQYLGDNYTPHCTVYKDKRLQNGQLVNIDNVALVDMFVGEDPYQRKVCKVIKFIA